MLSVAARAACVRFAAGASVVTAAHETDAAHCDAVRRKMTPIGAFSLLSETPAAPSIPAVLLTFKAPLAAADLRDALTAGVAPASARFRSRVDERALEFVDDLGPAAAPFVVERGARGEAALPGALGVEAAGSVVTVGEGVTHLAPGMRVRIQNLWTDD